MNNLYVGLGDAGVRRKPVALFPLCAQTVKGRAAARPSTGSLRTGAGYSVSSSRPVTAASAATTIASLGSSLGDSCGGRGSNIAAPPNDGTRARASVQAGLDAAAHASVAGDFILALECAKEASRPEQLHAVAHENLTVPGSSSISLAAQTVSLHSATDVSFGAGLSLGRIYELSRLDFEAEATFSALVAPGSAATTSQAGRAHCCKGAAQIANGHLSTGTKAMRMALDALPAGARRLRTRVQRSLGLACARQGRFQEAIAAFEAVVSSASGHICTAKNYSRSRCSDGGAAADSAAAAHHALVCQVLLGDATAMRSAFMRLLAVSLILTRPELARDDSLASSVDTTTYKASGVAAGPDSVSNSVDMRAALRRKTFSDGRDDVGKFETRDALAELIDARKRWAQGLIVSAARLVSPHVGGKICVVDGDASGNRSSKVCSLPLPFDFAGSLSHNAASLCAATINPDVTDTIDSGWAWTSAQLAFTHPEIRAELDQCRAEALLAHHEPARALALLLALEQSGSSCVKTGFMRARIATNLTCLYIWEGNIECAWYFANIAARGGRYSARALVNAGTALVSLAMSSASLHVSKMTESSEVTAAAASIVSAATVSQSVARTRARELFLEAVGVQADCAEAMLNLGIVCAALGALSEAAAAWEKLRALAPEAPEAPLLLARLAYRTALVCRGSRGDSIVTSVIADTAAASVASEAQLLDAALAAAPFDARALARCAAAFARANDGCSALLLAKEAARTAPLQTHALFALAACHVRARANAATTAVIARAEAARLQIGHWMRRLMAIRPCRPAATTSTLTQSDDGADACISLKAISGRNNETERTHGEEDIYDWEACDDESGPTGVSGRLSSRILLDGYDVGRCEGGAKPLTTAFPVDSDTTMAAASNNRGKPPQIHKKHLFAAPATGGINGGLFGTPVSLSGVNAYDNFDGIDVGQLLH